MTKTNAGPDFLLELQQRCRAAYVTRRRWIVRERLRQRRRQPQLLRGEVASPLLLVQPLGLRGGGAEQRVGQAGERAHAQSEGAGPSAWREAVEWLDALLRSHLGPRPRAFSSRRAIHRARRRSGGRGGTLQRGHVHQADGTRARLGERGHGRMMRDEDAEHAGLARQVVERRVRGVALLRGELGGG